MNIKKILFFSNYFLLIIILLLLTKYNMLAKFEFILKQFGYKYTE